jgi:hypothetical protein
MTRFIALLFASAALAAIAVPARADATAKQFLQLVDSEDGRALGETKIVALEEGVRITNASLASAAKLYCQPATLVLTGPQLADMVRRAVAANDKLEDTMMSTVLLDVLKSTFPCAAAAH